MTAFAQTGTILDRILARTAQEVTARKQRTSVAELGRLAADRPEPVSLKRALARSTPAVIAEFKRASPSKGRFAFTGTPAEVVAEYLAGGATAVSVLTDGPFFQGSLADMRQAAEVTHAAETPAPILRKDFVIDEYQVLEARAFHADAVLLIVAALTDSRLAALLESAAASGLEALVEVHEEAEMERALSLGADLIGINNRDLRTFEVDLAVTERLAPLAANRATVVSESGIFTGQDVARVCAAGAGAVLVGESLVTANDRIAAVRALTSIRPAV